MKYMPEVNFIFYFKNLREKEAISWGETPPFPFSQSILGEQRL